MVGHRGPYTHACKMWRKAYELLARRKSETRPSSSQGINVSFVRAEANAVFSSSPLFPSNCHGTRNQFLANFFSSLLEDGWQRRSRLKSGDDHIIQRTNVQTRNSNRRNDGILEGESVCPFFFIIEVIRRINKLNIKSILNRRDFWEIEIFYFFYGFLFFLTFLVSFWSNRWAQDSSKSSYHRGVKR